jgi:hypothetical protein
VTKSTPRASASQRKWRSTTIRLGRALGLMVRVFGMSNHRVMARGAGGFATRRRVVLKRAYRSSITGPWLRSSRRGVTRLMISFMINFTINFMIDFPCVA